MRTCDYCDAKHFGHGMCSKHYWRWENHGDPEWEPAPPLAVVGCAVDGCETKGYARGYCVKHYRRWKRHGDPEHTRPSLWERFWDKVDFGDGTGCWMWTAASDEWGYGQILIGRRPESAHRVSYEMCVGDIPEGLTIDHLCRVPSCVNPLHMEPVTASENTRRMHEARRREMAVA